MTFAAIVVAAAASAVVAAAPAPAKSAPSGTRGTLEGQVRFESRSLLGTKAVEGPQHAVVFLEQVDGPAPPPAKTPEKMVQRNKAFEPRLIVVTQGSAVDFPNEDVIFHNVFSLSQGNQFDLGVYRQGATKRVRFTQPGVVDVFCNIHPDMIGSILVLQNAHWVRVEEDGRYRLEVPPGKHQLTVYWAQGVLERREVEVSAGGVATVDFTLVDTGRPRHLNKHGQQYGRYK